MNRTLARVPCTSTIAANALQAAAALLGDKCGRIRSQRDATRGDVHGQVGRRLSGIERLK